MKAVTSKEFKEYIEQDPAWASKLTAPTEVTDYCDMSASKITHLSPLLHFTGKDGNQNSATFKNCQSLRKAEGNFVGCVDFSRSSVKEIGDLSCGKNSCGNSAFFFNCRYLEIAQGTYTGFVDFSYSSIRRIENLTCGENDEGIRLDVEHCLQLEKIPINFNPKEIEGYQRLVKKLEKDRLKETARKHFQAGIIEI